jgi:predicted AlkP superfamily phosphohydrolase/phosphomutase
MLALDAVEPLELEAGIEAGRYPALASFFAGATGVLLAPNDEAFHGSSWPTFNTGVTLAGHRVIRDRRLADGSYRIEDVRASAHAAPPFWRYLSDHGLRSTVSDLYSAPVLDGFDGTQIQGWASMDPYTSKFGTPLVDPPDTLTWLEREAGRPTLAYDGRPLVSYEEIRRYRDARVQDARTRARAYALLLERNDWDFFYVSFPEAHHAGHLLWHVHDPAHPAHDPTAPQDVRDALRAIYDAIDEGVGSLRALLPPDQPFLIVSPHGMGANTLPGDPADEVLARAGWFTRVAAGGGQTGVGRRLKSAAWQGARRVVPEGARLAMRRRVADRAWVEALALVDVDWSTTRAFTLPPDAGSYIRLNVRGREPQGTIEPGDEYERFVAELVTAFGNLTVGPDGPPAVERILLPDEIAGPRAPDGLPDVAVIWSTDVPVDVVHSDRLGTLEVAHSDLRTGQHLARGYALASAPWIEPTGGLAPLDPTRTLADLAPTVLSILGVPAPERFEGKPLPELAGANLR